MKWLQRLFGKRPAPESFEGELIPEEVPHPLNQFKGNVEDIEVQHQMGRKAKSDLRINPHWEAARASLQYSKSQTVLLEECVRVLENRILQDQKDLYWLRDRMKEIYG